MKLIIQIPCLNEEKTLPLVLAEIPKKIDGIDEIETMIIDDGSIDRTIEVAKELGVNHIVKHIGNKGLGVAFKSGQEKALELGADILVNTDGDNQYPGKYIADLVKPIINGEAEIVISDIQTRKIKHFSILKKFFQWLGSLLVRFLSGTQVPDTVVDLELIVANLFLKINVSSRFSYVLDTIVQAGAKGLKIKSIKITVNPPTCESRLFKSMWQHMRKSFGNLFRVYTMYNPLKLFLVLATPFLIVGLIGIGRFLYYYILDPVDTGKIQSLLLSGVLILISMQFFALGIIGDLISKNRSLIEDNLYFTKKKYFEKKKKLFFK